MPLSPLTPSHPSAAGFLLYSQVPGFVLLTTFSVKMLKKKKKGQALNPDLDSEIMACL